MEFLIITGLSGAGKSRAADVLEDLDYYCVDNMPVALMPRAEGKPSAKPRRAPAPAVAPACTARALTA